MPSFLDSIRMKDLKWSFRRLDIERDLGFQKQLIPGIIPGEEKSEFMLIFSAHVKVPLKMYLSQLKVAGTYGMDMAKGVPDDPVPKLGYTSQGFFQIGRKFGSEGFLICLGHPFGLK